MPKPKKQNAPEGVRVDLAGGLESTDQNTNTGAQSTTTGGIFASKSTSTTTYFAVKDWNTFQHYGKRNPPWIKLHRAILDDYAFCSLSDTAKGHLMLLWVYASQNNGQVPRDAAFLERKLSITGLDIDALVARGFLVESGAAGRGQSGASK